MILQKRWFILVLAAGALCALAVGFVVAQLSPDGKSATARVVPPRRIVGDPNKKTLDGRQVSEYGTLEYPNAAGHPGDPEEAVKDFKKFYAALDAFRVKHGRFPTHAEFRDTSKPLVEGHNLTEADRRNPDWKYSESPGALLGMKPGSTDYAVPFLSRRPDGTPKPAFPAAGELDVWMFSNLTAKSNAVIYQDSSKDVLYSGEYVVLFSDGSIRKFKHKETFFVECSWLPGPPLSFPGMTGYTKVAFDFEHSPYAKASRVFRVSYEE